MTKARDISKLLSTANGKIAGENLDVSFENITDTGTEGTRVATGTTAQRGSTTGQLRFNSTTGLAEYYTGTAFKSIDTPPTVTSLDVTEVDSNAVGNQTIVITGGNFQSGATVTFIGANGTNITPSTVTLDSESQITTVTPKSSFLNAQEPYGVKVENLTGLSTTLASQINVDTAPSWQTASGTLATINSDATGTHATVSATDPDGDTVAYSETGGSVLSGQNLTLNSSSGTISGDPTDVANQTTLNFTLRATANTKTADRAFNIIINPIPDGSTFARAIPVSQDANVINAVLSKNGETNGSVTEGVYFVQTVGSDTNTYTYPIVLRNISSNTWMCVSKNFIPHAYKNGDSVNSNDHPLSYGLMDASNNALSGLNSNMGASASNGTASLGNLHMRVAVDSFSGTWSTQLGVYDRAQNFYTRNHGTGLRLKLSQAQAYDDNNYDLNSAMFYSMSGVGTRYFVFKGYTTDEDDDTGILSMTGSTSTSHDVLNEPNEWEGITWWRDGNNNWINLNQDQYLDGTSSYASASASSQWGRLSIWIR